jgi:microcystin-dependent protein
MSDQYVGEIRMWPCPKVPNDWHVCDGSPLNISQYQQLYSVIGETYGGDGHTTFNLPDLRGRLPIHQGQGTGLANRVIGSKGGATSVILSASNLPLHTHGFTVSTDPASITTPSPEVVLGAAPSADSAYYQAVGYGETLVSLANDAIQDQPLTPAAHSNVMPSFTVNFIIALQGLYPEQN